MAFKHSELITALRDLRSLQEHDDPSVAHEKADAILCDVLASLGYHGIVEAYNAISKWYD